jgi:2-polyprenyl-3-methyl-5-hydroxy-6-metoxy-1,4-benzoquinol methylase
MLISEADDDVRFVPGESGTDSFCAIAHTSRYKRFIENFKPDGLSVLDFGCGSGYGADMIGRAGAKVVGLDISPNSIEYAARTYRSAEFSCRDLTDENLPASLGRKFDFVVSFDVIEHVENWWQFVSNIAALLDQGGTAVVGCPNRLATFDFNHDWNRHHLQEFTPLQLHHILKQSFPSVNILGQSFKQKGDRAKYTVSPRSPSWYAKEAIRNSPAGPIARAFKHAISPQAPKSSSPDVALDIITFRPIDLTDHKSHYDAFGLVAVCSLL